MVNFVQLAIVGCLLFARGISATTTTEWITEGSMNDCDDDACDSSGYTEVTQDPSDSGNTGDLVESESDSTNSAIVEPSSENPGSDNPSTDSGVSISGNSGSENPSSGNLDAPTVIPIVSGNPDVPTELPIGSGNPGVPTGPPIGSGNPGVPVTSLTGLPTGIPGGSGNPVSTIAPPGGGLGCPRWQCELSTIAIASDILLQNIDHTIGKYLEIFFITIFASHEEFYLNLRYLLAGLLAESERDIAAAELEILILVAIQKVTYNSTVNVTEPLSRAILEDLSGDDLINAVIDGTNCAKTDTPVDGESLASFITKFLLGDAQANQGKILGKYAKKYQDVFKNSTLSPTAPTPLDENGATGISATLLPKNRHGGKHRVNRHALHHGENHHHDRSSQSRHKHHQGNRHSENHPAGENRHHRDGHRDKNRHGHHDRHDQNRHGERLHEHDRHAHQKNGEERHGTHKSRHHRGKERESRHGHHRHEARHGDHREKERESRRGHRHESRGGSNERKESRQGHHHESRRNHHEHEEHEVRHAGKQHENRQREHKENRHRENRRHEHEESRHL